MLTTGTFVRLFHITLIRIFCSSFFVQYSNQHKMYVHVPIQLSWNEARNYCLQHHTDLVTIKSQQESEAVEHLCTAESQCWIGLRRTLGGWQWLDGEVPNFTQWKTTDMDFKLIYYCATLGGDLWFHSLCWNAKEFVCYDENMILVKEKKTWESALEHCRSLDMIATMDNTYDLMHVTLEEVDYVKKALLFAQTDRVWIGLRFLAGQWLWLNGSPLQEQLPTCPSPDMHCGTLANGSENMQSHDCNEENNFLCMRLQIV